MEQPNTECVMCGNVWQEHTITEDYACRALMRLGFAVAQALDATRKGKAVPADRQVVLCPVCGKTSEEHTEANLVSCLAKWRKREQGSTGLELQHIFLEAHGDNADPDPVKEAQRRAGMLQRLCSCGKTLGDHTSQEITACAERNRQ
jgi:protein-arginine kinase activator protein McsA